MAGLRRRRRRTQNEKLAIVAYLVAAFLATYFVVVYAWLGVLVTQGK